MPDQVPEAIKAERVSKIEELCERLHDAFISANKGLTERVLWESTNRKGMMEGYTGNYIRLTRPYDPAKVGNLEEIII